MDEDDAVSATVAEAVDGPVANDTVGMQAPRPSQARTEARISRQVPLRHHRSAQHSQPESLSSSFVARLQPQL